MANTTANTAVSWLHAYPPLPILASSAMAQPAGRLLGVSAVNSVWLRVSPLLCALDALALIVRCLVYCIALRATPRQALVLIGTDRFADADTTDDTPSTERGTTSRIAAVARAATATAIRLAGFALGVVPLVELIWFEPGGHEARWTAAWAWLYIGAYLLLEAAAAVYQWEQAQPQYTAADFELDEVDGGRETIAAGSGVDGVPYDGVSSRGSEETPRKSDDGQVEEDNNNDEDDDKPVDDAETADLLARGGERSDTGAATTSTAATTSSPNTAADLEANTDKIHPYEYKNDPSSHPRLPAINAVLSKIDSYCIGLGWLAHALFLYWAFLDLVQPPINAHILVVDVTKGNGWEMVSGWATPLYYLSLPFTFVALLLIMGITLGAGALVACILLGIAKGVTSQLPPSVTNWARGLVPFVITYGLGALGGLATIISFFMGSPMLGDILLSSHMAWIYSMLSFETVLFVLYLGACFVFYAIIKGAVGAFKAKYGGDNPTGTDATGTGTATGTATATATATVPTPADGAPKWAARILPYTSDDSVALLAVALHTLVLSLVWYAIRFAASSHWRQNWADALVANVTATNGTMTNGTANATVSIAASMAITMPSSTPVQLF